MSIAVQPTPKDKAVRNKHRLLMQTTTGAIYTWNENLAKRADMIEWKHPSRQQRAPQKVKTPDEIKMEAMASMVEESQEQAEPSVAEMAKAVLSKGKKSASQE